MLNSKLKTAGKSTVEFHVLRKATNQQLKTLLRNKEGSQPPPDVIQPAVA